VSRVLDFGQQQAGSFWSIAEPTHRRHERPAEDVVGQHHDRGVVPDELSCQSQGLGDPSRPFLVRVEQALHAELLAVRQEPEELARVRAARHDHHLGDPGLYERLDP